MNPALPEPTEAAESTEGPEPTEPAESAGEAGSPASEKPARVTTREEGATAAGQDRLPAGYEPL